MREVYLGFRSIQGISLFNLDLNRLYLTNCWLVRAVQILIYYTEGIKAQAGRFYSLNDVESSYLGYFYFYILVPYILVPGYSKLIHKKGMEWIE